MQAITTKYLNPTDAKGARIKATCDAGSITIPYPHELSGTNVHAKAAMALVRKLGWHSTAWGSMWAAGSINQSDYAFVAVGGTSTCDTYFAGYDGVQR